MRYQVQMNGLFLMCALFFCPSRGWADDKVQQSAKDFKIVQFPNESWDGKTLQYYILVQFPKVSGKTNAEAEQIRKRYVTQSLRKGIQFLFNLATYDPTEISFGYEVEDCRKEDTLPKTSVAIAPLEQERLKVIELCKFFGSDSNHSGRYYGRSKESKKNSTNIYGDRDISAKSFDDIFAFGSFISKNKMTLEFGSKNFPNLDVDNGFDSRTTTLLLHTRDTEGKLVDVLNTNGLTNQLEKPKDRFLSPSAMQGEVRSEYQLPEGYEISYRIPSVSLGGSVKDNVLAQDVEVIVPNKKLVTFFQGSGPNVTSAMMNAAQTTIEKILKPFDLEIALPPNGGLASLASKHEPSEDETPRKGKSCLEAVNLRACKEIWAYWLLSNAKIDAERDKANPNQVTFSVSVPMESINKVKVGYEKYMAK